MSVNKNKGLMFVLPSIAGMFLFYIYPFARSLLRSFSNGIYAYSSLFSSEAFLLAAQNTALFLVLGLILIGILSLGLAFIFQNMTTSGVSALLLPMLLPSGIIVLFVNAVTGEWSGGVESFVGLLGIYLWKNTGYCLIILLAGLACVEKASIEAAKLDGASHVRIFLQVQFPQIRSFSCFSVLIALTNSFKIFRESYLLFGDQPPDSVYMMQNFRYNNFLAANDQRLAAVSVILIICIGIPILLLLRYGGKNDA